MCGYLSPPESNDASIYDPPKRVTAIASDSPRVVASKLEQTTFNDIAAVNSRTFGPESVLFVNKADYFEAQTSAALSDTPVSCQGFVDALKRACALFPEFKVRALDFTTTVDLELGKAEVFANVETTGRHEGVAQRNVSICEYHLIGGVWMHVKHMTMTGMDPMSGMGGM
ncbi:uncharacterized protein RCC_12063 [Ramularia collo-cygni]|uniref:SnoaL-like domain-containing protein n=1 Tax=Ramularia collo-cygni TaxID=112498 RepID=A0A2D3UQY4_9PEZI|nr:uncharacterized protein RCC_12063 [Ramularia collo-cygni]CZT14720.1 uncharacterized protein RCC_12063 [Ramularia collo-cygni]